MEQISTMTPKELQSIGLKPEKRFDMWSKYSSYAPEHIQNTWLYTKPSVETITQAQSIKTGRTKQTGNVNAPHPSLTDTVLEETGDNSSENVSAIQEGGLPGMPKRRGRPPGSKNKKARKTM